MHRMIQDLSAARIKIFILCILGLLHLFLTLTLTVPGHLSIDEAIYHLMVKNFAATGGLEIWTGYQECPSPELTHEFLRIHAGRPVSQYPYLFPVLALPFFAVTGYYGLFLTNALAFVGVVLLCYATARKLFGDTDLALNSCLILVAVTFSWDYSQSAWPPTTSVLFTMAAFYTMIRAYYAESKRESLWSAAATGLIAGFAPGVHMTTAIVLPCLILPFLFTRPSRPVEAIVVVVASVPGLAVLAWTNYIKFGVAGPFSYGAGLRGFGPSVPITLVLAACGIIFVGWVLTRAETVKRLRGRWWILLCILACVIVALAMIPGTRKLFLRVADGAWMMLVDLRIRGANMVEPALRRTATGGLVYIGGLKKALLQSMPYLTVLFVPAAALLHRKEDFGRMAMLFMIPLFVTGYFSHLLDHGGLSLNLRYFLPVLPFTSILTAYAMRDLRFGPIVRSHPRAWLLPAAAVVGSCYLLLHAWPPTSRDLEFVLLTVPLFAALLLLSLLIAREFLKKQGAVLITTAACAVLTVTLIWSFLVAFFYDYPLHRNHRAGNYAFGAKVMKLIPPDSVFFTAPYIDPFLRLIEKDRVRIALPANDRFKDFPRLVGFYLDSGRRVFAAFPMRYWRDLKAGPLAQYAVTPIFRFSNAFVAEISRGAPPERPSRLPNTEK